MFNNGKDFVAISINDDSVRILKLKCITEGTKVLDVLKKDVRDLADEEIARSIGTGLANFKMRKPKTICIVPSNLVTTKNIEIPSLDPAEIKSIIDLQAGRHTPYAREEIIVGYINIGVFQHNFTKVLLVIVNREVIKRQVEILEAGGAAVELVVFASEGSAIFYANALKVTNESPAVGIIDVNSQSTDFIIEYNRTVAMCRGIPVGLTHMIKDGSAALDQLIEEIRKSLESYQNEDVSALPDTFHLVTDDATLKEIQPVLQDELKASVRVSPYLDYIQAEQDIMLKFVSEYSDESFLKEVAIANSIDNVQVDLTPPEIRMQRSIEEKGRQIIIAGVMGLLLIIILAGMFWSKIYFRSIYLEKIRQEYAKKRIMVQSLQGVARKAQIIKDYLRGRKLSLNIIKELYALIPDDIYLDIISLEENGTITIQGISESLASVFDFVTSLKESELLKDVSLKATTDKKDRGKEVTFFEIEFKHIHAKEVVETEEEQILTEEAEG